MLTRLAVAALVLTAACAAPHVVSTPAPIPSAGTPIRYSHRSDSTRFVTGRLVSLDSHALAAERFVPNARDGRWLPVSVPTDSLAGLQVLVGKRSNGGRGALIGGIAGAALALACEISTPKAGSLDFTGSECTISALIAGPGAGFLIGSLSHSDVWAPVMLPPDHPPGVISVRRGPGLGVRIPFRLGVR
jgi:hypothetical protein